MALHGTTFMGWCCAGTPTRTHVGGRNACRGDVQQTLPFYYPHATCAQVPQSQDPLPVCHHHYQHPLQRLEAELLQKAPTLAGTQVEAICLYGELMVVLARLSHSRRVQIRQHGFGVQDEQAVEDPWLVPAGGNNPHYASWQRNAKKIWRNAFCRPGCQGQKVRTGGEWGSRSTLTFVDVEAQHIFQGRFLIDHADFAVPQTGLGLGQAMGSSSFD
jgi:hypothetical protein